MFWLRNKKIILCYILLSGGLGQQTQKKKIMKRYPACKELFLCFLFQYILRAAITVVTVGDMVPIRMTTPAVAVKVGCGYSSGSTSKGDHSCMNVLSLIQPCILKRKHMPGNSLPNNKSGTI